jgi:hypothetical protein
LESFWLSLFCLNMLNAWIFLMILIMLLLYLIVLIFPSLSWWWLEVLVKGQFFGVHNVRGWILGVRSVNKRLRVVWISFDGLSLWVSWYATSLVFERICERADFALAQCQGTSFMDTQCQGAYALKEFSSQTLSSRIDRNTEFKS